MTLADSAGLALAVTAVLAVAARLAGALTTGGAVAGAVIGACVSVGFGLPGLAVLGTFFVVGTLATRVGWEKKKARGTAEAGEGRRDWKRVVGKGGVAAAIALIVAIIGKGDFWPFAFAGSVSAALADTLGTEIGTLSTALPRTIPSLRHVPVGTPGAVSARGTVAAAIGGAIVGVVFSIALDGRILVVPVAVVGIAGLLASLLESFAVGKGLRAAGYIRNVFTTLAGALITFGLCSVVLLALVAYGPRPL